MYQKKKKLATVLVSKKLTLLTFLIVFCCFKSTLNFEIDNRDFAGNMIRRFAWYLMNHLKTFEKPKLKDLWDYSYRGFALNVLKVVTFKDQQDRSDIHVFNQKWENQLNEYLAYKNLPLTEEILPIDQPKNVNEIYFNIMKIKRDEIPELKEIIREKATVLKKVIHGEDLSEFDEEKQNEFIEWELLYHEYEQIENILAEIKIMGYSVEAIPFMKSSLEEFEEKHKNLSEDIEAIEANLLNYTVMNEAIEKLQGLENKGNSEFDQSVKNLRTEKKKLEENVNSKKESLISKLKKILNNLKKGKLVKISEYTEYKKAMKNLKNKEEERIKLQKNYDKLHFEFEKNKIPNKVNEWKRRRVLNGRFLKISNELKELEEMYNELDQSMEYMQAHPDEDITESKKYLQILQDDLNIELIEQRIKELKEEFAILKDFHEMSIELDVKLAKVFANLVNGRDENGVVYFSPNELSVLIYFMSITKVIYSNENFLIALFSEMNTSFCQNVVSRLYLDMLDIKDIKKIEVDRYCLMDEYPDSQILENKSDFIRDYTLFLETQKNDLLKEFMTEDAQQTNFNSTMFSFLNINPASVMMNLKKTLFVHYLKDIATGIFVIAGIGTGYPFLISMLTVLLGIIAEYILRLIGKSLPKASDIIEYQNIMYEKMQKTYKAITSNEFENLEYEETMKELEENFKDSFIINLEKAPEDVRKFYVSKAEVFGLEAWVRNFNEETINQLKANLKARDEEELNVQTQNLIELI